MSEPQTEYETEQETDAEPTGGPWEFDLELGAGDSFVWGPDGDAVAIMGARASVEEKKANARLIAAAGTAAQKAKEMGYDALSFTKNSVHLLRELENIANGHIEDGMTPAEVAQNALASAEGSEE